MAGMRRLRWSVPASLSLVAAVAALATLGCTTPSGSGVLSVANHSDATLYIRFDAEPDQVVIYRVDPGAVGRVQAVDPGRRPDKMTTYSADCVVTSEESDPALGQMVIDQSSTVFTAAPDPDIATKPLLPIDGTCRNS
jgi:hypothetical protein